MSDQVICRDDESAPPLAMCPAASSSSLIIDLALLESGKFIAMCQVSRKKLGLIDGRVELDLDVVESPAQPGIDGCVTGKHGREVGPKKAVHSQNLIHLRIMSFRDYRIS
jgi:hypothetical protein